jgi:hypothetical protein
MRGATMKGAAVSAVGAVADQSSSSVQAAAAEVA